MRERLDDLQIPDHLVDEARLLGARRRLLLEHGIGVRGDELGDEEGKRRHAEHDERDLPAQHEEDDEHAQNGRRARKQLRKAEEKAVGELLGVRDDDGGRLAVGAAVEIL